MKTGPKKKDLRVGRSEADLLFARANEQWESGSLLSAFRLFLAGAKGGDQSAQHNLGYFYDSGLGVKRNRAAALYWYKLAYRQGSMTAANNIGTMFRDEENTKDALLWFRRAISLGDADANLEVANIYLRGERGSARAIVYLKRAIKAKRDDITEWSRQEARRLLRQLLRKRTQGKHSGG